MAKNNYIARMDADDICHTDRFEKQLNFLAENKDIDIVGSNAEIFGNTDEAIEKSLNLDINGDIETNLLNNWYCIAHPSLIFRKKVFECLNGYNDYYAEDLEILLRALRNGFKLFKINEALIDYRIHDAAKSKRINTDGIRDAIIHKVRYIREVYNVKPDKYLIWGAGSCGTLTLNTLKNTLRTAHCLAFIDSNKTGTICDVPIITPDKIFDSEFDYIFVATQPGKDYATSFLESHNIKPIINYLCTA